MSILNGVLNHTRDELIKACVTNLDEDDPSRAGIVKIGFLQGDPDPDEARVSISIFPNDPDQEIRGSGIGNSPTSWEDNIVEEEVGGVLTWSRKFTIKARCLFTNGTEADDEVLARSLAATVKARIERTILRIKYDTVQSEDEYVARSPISANLLSSLVQSGGPGAYDFYIKVRFDILTTTL